MTGASPPTMCASGSASTRSPTTPCSPGPHVRARLDELMSAYAGSFEPSATMLEERLSSFDPTDLAALQETFSNPEVLLGEMETPAQRQLMIPLQALLSAVVGYVDHVMDTVGRRLIGSYGPLTEALHRRRLEDAEGTRFVARVARRRAQRRRLRAGRGLRPRRARTGGRSRAWPACGSPSGSCRPAPSSTPRDCGWPASTFPIRVVGPDSLRADDHDPVVDQGTVLGFEDAEGVMGRRPPLGR